MDVRPGVQLASAVCGGRIVVVRVASDRVPDVACGGQPMVPVAQAGAHRLTIDPTLRSGAQVGKRYEADGLEVLCTAPGEGTLTCDGVPMTVKSAKPLPASD